MLTSAITNTKVNNYTNENRSSNLDASPGASRGPDASQFMKSFMKSYNAGNVQFYDNLHKKYFDKAKDKDDNDKLNNIGLYRGNWGNCDFFWRNSLLAQNIPHSSGLW